MNSYGCTAKYNTKEGLELLEKNTQYSPEFDFSDIGNDKELEKTMATELYDELRGEDTFLSINTFLEWDDIKDVLEQGLIDLDTIGIILKEAGVNQPWLTFDQFFEVVDLVNQVSIMFEGDGLGLGDDDEDEDDKFEETFMEDLSNRPK